MIDTCTKKILHNSDIIIIFWSSYCGYSQAVIEVLKENKMAFKAYNISDIKGGFQNLLLCLTRSKNLTGFNPQHQTRPVIFYKSKFIGGYNELKNFIEKNN